MLMGKKKIANFWMTLKEQLNFKITLLAPFYTIMFINSKAFVFVKLNI